MEEVAACARNAGIVCDGIRRTDYPFGLVSCSPPLTEFRRPQSCLCWSWLSRLCAQKRAPLRSPNPCGMVAGFAFEPVNNYSWHCTCATPFGAFGFKRVKSRTCARATALRATGFALRFKGCKQCQFLRNAAVVCADARCFGCPISLVSPLPEIIAFRQAQSRLRLFLAFSLRA